MYPPSLQADLPGGEVLCSLPQLCNASRARQLHERLHDILTDAGTVVEMWTQQAAGITGQTWVTHELNMSLHQQQQQQQLQRVGLKWCSCQVVQLSSGAWAVAVTPQPTCAHSGSCCCCNACEVWMVPSFSVAARPQVLIQLL